MSYCHYSFNGNFYSSHIFPHSFQSPCLHNQIPHLDAMEGILLDIIPCCEPLADVHGARQFFSLRALAAYFLSYCNTTAILNHPWWYTVEFSQLMHVQIYHKGYSNTVIFQNPLYHIFIHSLIIFCIRYNYITCSTLKTGSHY